MHKMPILDRIRFRYGIRWNSLFDWKKQLTGRVVLHAILYLAFFLASLVLLNIFVNYEANQIRIRTLEAQLKFRDEQLLNALNGQYAGLFTSRNGKVEVIVSRCTPAETFSFPEDDPTWMNRHKE